MILASQQMKSAMSALAERLVVRTRVVIVISAAPITPDVTVGILPPETVQPQAVEIVAGTRGVLGIIDCQN